MKRGWAVLGWAVTGAIVGWVGYFQFRLIYLSGQVLSQLASVIVGAVIGVAMYFFRSYFAKDP